MAQALGETLEGEAFTTAQAAGAGTTEAWATFAGVLDTDYRSRLSDAAGEDPRAQEALTALNTYVTVSASLRAGEPPEFLDPQAAETAIKTGQEPETNPAYTEAVASLTDAHVALSECLPTWPVLF